MSDVSRPATAEDLKRLVQALDAAGARYLLIGAYALLAHGYQRATVDIDLLVEATRENGERVKQALLVLPDQSAREIDPDGKHGYPQPSMSDISLRRAAAVPPCRDSLDNSFADLPEACETACMAWRTRSKK